MICNIIDILYGQDTAEIHVLILQLKAICQTISLGLSLKVSWQTTSLDFLQL